MLDFVFTGPVIKSKKENIMSYLLLLTNQAAVFFSFSFVIILNAFVVIDHIYTYRFIMKIKSQLCFGMGHQRNCLHRTWYKVINGRHYIIILLPSPNQAADFSSVFYFLYPFCSQCDKYLFSI